MSTANINEIECSGCGAVFKSMASLGNHGRYSKTCTADKRFWGKVDKEGAGGCWNWTASCKEKGYGQVFHQGKMYRAHRLSWLLTGRSLPAKGLELAHRCDNRICVNPEHLFVATHAENMADCKAKGRYSRTGNKPRGATA